MKGNMLHRKYRVIMILLPVFSFSSIYFLFRSSTCESQTIDLFYLANRARRDLMRDDSLFHQMRVNNERLSHAGEMCEHYNRTDPQFLTRPTAGEAFITPDDSLVFCDIPKVGCTYWKQIIRFLSHDYEGTPASPEEIPREFVHFGDWEKTTVTKLSSLEQANSINRKGYKFMVTRDPYARLWSGYLDKLFLPDFWGWFGTSIVRRIRKDAKDWSKKCGDDVTFSEYLQFIAEELSAHKKVDRHFVPIHTLCNPCQVRFDAIGKIETFSADSKYILNENDISHVMAHAQKVDRSLEEIRMLTIYNFDIQDRLISTGISQPECFKQNDIAFRLWQVFQMNGYIGDEYKFPQEIIKSVTSRNDVKTVLLDTLYQIRGNATSDDIKRWKNQRGEYLKKAYMGVTLDTKRSIRDAFQKDFEIFDYEKEPLSIFP